MIFGKHKKWVVGTTKLIDGIEVLGRIDRRGRVVASRYGDKIQAKNAITNYCRSLRFRKKVVEKYNFKFNLINITDQYWYIRVSERGIV
jgi:hypothetical protein